MTMTEPESSSSEALDEPSTQLAARLELFPSEVADRQAQYVIDGAGSVWHGNEDISAGMREAATLGVLTALEPACR